MDQIAPIIGEFTLESLVFVSWMIGCLECYQ